MPDKINDGKLSKRDQILDVSTQLFLEKGFQSVTMDQIAATVPVSKPTLYAHFADKRSLFYAAVEKRCHYVLATVKQSIKESKNFEEGLRIFGRQFLDILLRDEALRFHRVMVAESSSFPEMAQMFYESGPKKMREILSDFFTTSLKPDDIAIEDPSFSADMFLSMIKGNTHFRCLLGLDKPSLDPEQRDILIDRVINVFLNGHRTPA